MTLGDLVFISVVGVLFVLGVVLPNHKPAPIVPTESTERTLTFEEIKAFGWCVSPVGLEEPARLELEQKGALCRSSAKF